MKVKKYLLKKEPKLNNNKSEKPLILIWNKKAVKDTP
jgi:hypothetical protein